MVAVPYQFKGIRFDLFTKIALLINVLHLDKLRIGGGASPMFWGLNTSSVRGSSPSPRFAIQTIIWEWCSS